MSFSFLLVLWSLRCRLVLRTRVLERLHMALGTANALGLRSVIAPGLASLLDVRSLGDVRCSVDVSVVGDTAWGAARLRVITHVQIGLTDMTLL